MDTFIISGPLEASTLDTFTVMPFFFQFNKQRFGNSRQTFQDESYNKQAVKHENNKKYRHRTNSGVSFECLIGKWLSIQHDGFAQNVVYKAHAYAIRFNEENEKKRATRNAVSDSQNSIRCHFHGL